MFIDKARIHVRGGNGGDGVVAWRKEKFEPSGGPYGGDGGNGGSVIIKVDEGMRTLMDFRYQRVYEGERGENGRTKRMHGKAGEDIIIKVPEGTLIKDDETGHVIADLRHHDEEYIVAKGGKGGRGNARFATATRQAPNFAEPGTKGENSVVVLELKLLADVGLVGFPNVGKSTILSILSAAKPKIANYHFTTIKPNLGVVRVGEGKSFVMADIPGLIEGASEGIGLGHDFLRHVERTSVLVHVLDISGFEGRDPIEDFYMINEELADYNEKLSKKPQIIVANKMDLPNSEENLKKLKEEFEPKGYKIISISAGTRQGIEQLKYDIWDVVSNTEIEHDTYDIDYVHEEIKEEDIIVKIEDGEFVVEGPYIDKLLRGTHFDNVDSLRYFQESLRRVGIVDKLEALGIDEGDTVFICEHEFEFFF